MLKRNRRPTSPGTILRTYYMEPRKLTVTHLSKVTSLSRKHVSNIVNGKAAISPDTAMRFAMVLDTTPEFWLNLQNAADLYDAQRKLAAWKPPEIHPAGIAVG